MASRDPSIDLRELRTFSVTETSDPTELDTESNISNRLPALSRTYKYRLRDRALFGKNFKDPIVSLASRQSGGVVVSYGADRFAMDVTIDGDERNPLIFTTMLQGKMSFVRDGEEAICAENQGLIFRAEPDTHLLTTDNNARASIFLQAGELQSALEHMIDDRLHKPLEFARVVDWSNGLAASAKAQIDFVMGEFQRNDGVTSNAVAMASLTDLLVTLILHGLPHNYADKLIAGADAAAPRYVRHAEAFMRANATSPIRMAEVATAAGCSVRTLGAAFSRFRSTTPLHALHAIRLELAHDALRSATEYAPVAAIARRYGFTNAARFSTSYRRRFGEKPTETGRGTMLHNRTGPPES